MKVATVVIVFLVGLGVAVCPLLVTDHTMAPTGSSVGDQHEGRKGSTAHVGSAIRGVHASGECCHEKASAAVLASGTSPMALPTVVELTEGRPPEFSLAQRPRTSPAERPPDIASPLRC